MYSACGSVFCIVAVCNVLLATIQGFAHLVFVPGTVGADEVLRYSYCSTEIAVPFKTPTPSPNVLVKPSPVHPFHPLQVLPLTPGLALVNVVCALTLGICAYACWTPLR